ncbi:hypothetical protein BDV41DRAFT_522672 [Aspergillus transmontanensis]|uniref:Uncharacterized protein n=1 Tax=Aspergillus transmontanensis TaxID=1034304 RepID=A0A5N6WDB6_9EURO|nr:hypothetical protein BDV41DRAFT_522672 [Aspergillus transmontanensis]
MRRPHLPLSPVEGCLVLHPVRPHPGRCSVPRWLCRVGLILFAAVHPVARPVAGRISSRRSREPHRRRWCLFLR